MKVDGIDIPQTVASIKQQIEQDRSLSPSLRVAVELLLLVVTVLCNRLGLNSKNSSKPPSSDLNREKVKRTTGKKPGGQAGRIGTTLTKFDQDDVIEILELDASTLPPGNYSDAGFESRQVDDIEFQRLVTEYRAQVLVNSAGQRFVAAFPAHVTRRYNMGKA